MITEVSLEGTNNMSSQSKGLQNSCKETSKIRNEVAIFGTKHCDLSSNRVQIESTILCRNAQVIFTALVHRPDDGSGFNSVDSTHLATTLSVEICCLMANNFICRQSFGDIVRYDN